MTMKCVIRRAIAAVGLVSAMAITSSAVAADDVTLTADVGYVEMSNLPDGVGEVNPIRLQAIRETATQLGARGALAWQSRHINASLSHQARHLNHIFNFNQILIGNNVLPPVITQSNDNLMLDDGNTIRLASKTYEIVSPARFVTTAPSWRTYLWMDYKKPSLPSQTLLPHTKPEASAWNYYLKQGWISGTEQASDIFRENLDHLKRDYAGMVLYNQLLAKHMVSKPYVAKANMGVTGDGNKIRINDEVLRITAPSQLQPDASRWTPVLTH